MNNILKVLITGAGAPGIQGTIYSLKNNYDNRAIHIIGTDINDFVIGKYICDEFQTISSAKEKEKYLDDLLTISLKKGVNIILPQNTMELLILSENKDQFFDKGIGIVVSEKNAIELANNKYKLFQSAESKSIPITKYTLVSNFDDLKKHAIIFGWPQKKIVVKPPIANGSRGVRIVAEDFDRKKAFYEEKPSNIVTTLDELHSTLGDVFPELIVMEYLSGDEYTVDVFKNDKEIIAIPRKREIIRNGITFAASLEENKSLMDYSKTLASVTGLSFCFGFQFKMNEDGVPFLLESNPRVQGTMVMSTFGNANIIYSAIKLLLGEPIPSMNINWNTKLLRYWGAIGIQNGEFNRI